MIVGDADVIGPRAAGAGRCGVTFRLTTPAVLSRSEVFRDETLRTDLARQEAGWATARLVVVDDEGRTPVEWTDAPSAGFEVGDAGSWDRGGSARLRTRPTEGATPTEGAVLLGEQDGRGVLGGARQARRVRRGRPDRLGRPAHDRRRSSTGWARACSSPRSPSSTGTTPRATAPATARPTRVGRGGLAPALRGGRARGVPAHRPGRHLPRARRRLGRRGPRAARPPARLADRPVHGARRVRRGGGVARRVRAAGDPRGGRRPRPRRRPTSAARPGRSRAR